MLELFRGRWLRCRLIGSCYSGRPLRSEAVRSASICYRPCMVPYQDIAVPPEGGAFDTHDVFRVGVVWIALMMNFILALVNANVAAISPNIVLAVQLTVTAAAALVIVNDPPKVGPAFIVSMLAVLLGYVLSGLFHQELDARSLYDVMVIPIFMLLGMTMHRFRSWMINVPMAVVTIVALADGLLRDQFAAIVNPLSYYRSTRTWVAAQSSAFSEDSGLYVGADRSGGSIFSFISDHRVGSIFLEPLSLGYFAVIATIAYAIVYRDNRGKFLAGAALCIFLTLLADTRTAAFLVVVFVLTVFVTKHVSRLLVALVPLAILVLGGLIYLRTGGGGGELTFRLGLTYKAFLQTNSISFLVGDVSSEQIYDSGLIAIIHNIGVISTLILIYLVSGVLTSTWRNFSYVPLLAILYVMVTLLFGGAVFSIKTAALFGFMVGASGQWGGQLFLADQRGVKRTIDDKVWI